MLKKDKLQIIRQWYPNSITTIDSVLAKAPKETLLRIEPLMTVACPVNKILSSPIELKLKYKNNLS